MARQSIGEFLAALRKAHGYTQQEVADRLDVSNRTVSSWEKSAALPDILILPALAELYGVSVDEILAGERRSDPSPEKKLSKKSETKLFKRRLTKFFMQEYILGGVLFSGILLFLIGILTEFQTYVYSGIRWWLILLFTGLTAAIVSIAVFFALFFGALGSVDEDAEGSLQFLMLLKRSAARFLYVLSAELLLGAAASAVMSEVGPGKENAAALSIVLAALAVAAFLFGFVSVDRAFLKWGGAEYAARRARNKKLYKKAALFGLIPCAISLALALTLSFVNVTTRDLLYSADRESFKRYMETMTTMDGKEIFIPLSELSEGLGTTIEYEKQYEFDEHITYCFYFGFCTVQIWEGDVGTYIATDIKADRLTAEDGFFVYNLRGNATGNVTIGGDTVVSMYEEIRTEGDMALYERVFVENFGTLGRALGGAIFAAAGLAIFAVCAMKRERTQGKL